MAGSSSKRLRISSPSPSSSQLTVDVNLCIICQGDYPNRGTSSTENGRSQVIRAASIRQDIVNQRLQQVDNGKICYHVDNNCYKQYTLTKTIDRIKQSRTSDADSLVPTVEPSTSSSRERSRRSSITSRDSVCKPEDVNFFAKKCLICQFAKHGTDGYTKYRISEEDRANAFLKAALILLDEVYTRTCDLQDASAVFGADLYCHKNCVRNYIRKGERLSSHSETPSIGQQKLEVFLDVVKQFERGLNAGKCYNLSQLSDCCNKSVTGEQIFTFTNRDVKMYLISVYKNDLSFLFPQGSKAPTVFFKTSAIVQSVPGVDDPMDPETLKRFGELLRGCIMKQDFALDDKFCDANEIESAYRSIVLPPELAHFFSGLFNADVCCGQDNEDGDFEETLDDFEMNSGTFKRDKILSVYQVIYYILNNGRKRTPLHMMNSEAIYNACRSKTLVSSLNRFGLAISYDEILRYHSDMASLITECSQGRVPLPSNFQPNKFTMGAFDNFDHEEATTSGIGGSHDTVLILMQDKPEDGAVNRKPNRSETNVSHRLRQFTEELGCQVLRKYSKVSKKPSLSPLYEVSEELFEMDEADHNHARAKDAAWVVSRMDLSSEEIAETSDDQMMPSWSAFNSLVTDENVPQKVVGFLPVLPFPVTNYDTVYTALKNYQDVLDQLDQSHLPVASDEGVYHIAREIVMHNPNEFSNLILILGSFHLIKVVMGAIGKYIDGSGAETILTESKAFGEKVVRSVLDGSHYVRSLKGLMMLSESVERLQWKEFFKNRGVEPYMDELELLRLMKVSVSEKDRDRSKRLLDRFLSASGGMIEQFTIFKSQKSVTSETFAFWDKFVHMVALLKNLVRADREGNWMLHLECIQEALPLFAGCDRTNYLRWAAVYLEDMRRLQKDAPFVYENFMAGKFTVKRTEGRFNSIGADMCLEQTINRSQKSASGIIGNTKRKQFVAQWEIIYHEMLAVVNVQRQISGVAIASTELLVNHEFNKPSTQNSEAMVRDMIEYIKQHENPASPPSEGDLTEKLTLHNIFTQAIAPKEIRDDLLNFEQNSKELYNKFRTERFVTKEKSVFDTIHRNNLKTFKSMKPEKDKPNVGDKGCKKLAEAQKIFDIARVRNYDIKELLKYELVEKSYLFDENGLMTKPNKSELCRELEDEHLNKEKDYLPQAEWKKSSTASIIDVMCCIRHIHTAPLKTFGDLCQRFLDMVYGSCKDSCRLDFVFDTYLEGSVKDSERERRGSCSPIDLNNINNETPLPVSMGAFWASSANKAKLQRLLRAYILAHPRDMVDIVVSGVGMAPDNEPCQGIFNGNDPTPVPDLDVDIEEADVRIIPHALHATNCGATRVVLLSNDTDVVVLGIHYWSILKGHGLAELWIRAGSGSTTRYVPLHTLASKLGTQKSKVLVALHQLTGCDSTSKFGTKAASLKADPEKFLQNFGTSLDTDYDLIEEFLVHVYSSNIPCRTMDNLRYHLYHHSSKTILQLPPTSRSTRAHIQRAQFGTYMQLHCLDGPKLDPQDYGYTERDGILHPDKAQISLPDDFPMPCKCGTCATKRCPCRKLNIRCCPYCKCQASDKACKNQD